MTDDLNLHDELHDLADVIAPASASTARDRARRGIARRARNRRAAVGAGAAVLLVAATVFVAVDRDSKDSQRPIGTTAPTTEAPSTTTSTTVTDGVRRPILSTMPRLNDLPAAKALYTRRFAWGTNDDQVAFHTPQGEGVSGGPLAFRASADGAIAMLDHSSSRIVRFSHGTSPAIRIALADPGVTAAAFDDQGRVIVASSELAVFGPQGDKLGAWTGLGGPDGKSIGELDVHATCPTGPADPCPTWVYAVAGNRRVPLLRDLGSGYVPVGVAATEPAAVTVDITSNRHVTVFQVDLWARQYVVSTTVPVTGAHARLLPDGPIFVFVLEIDDGAQGPDEPATYVLGRIGPSGHAQFETVTASAGYLVNGPEFVINDNGLAVMGSTTTGGTTVSFYPFP